MVNKEVLPLRKRRFRCGGNFTFNTFPARFDSTSNMHWKITTTACRRQADPHLQRDGEHQHSENNRPKGPIPKNLENTLHCHRRLQPSPWRGTATMMRTGVQAGTGQDGATTMGC